MFYRKWESLRHSSRLTLNHQYSNYKLNQNTPKIPLRLPLVTGQVQAGEHRNFTKQVKENFVYSHYLALFPICHYLSYFTIWPFSLSLKGLVLSTKSVCQVIIFIKANLLVYSLCWLLFISKHSSHEGLHFTRTLYSPRCHWIALKQIILTEASAERKFTVYLIQIYPLLFWQ